MDPGRPESQSGVAADRRNVKGFDQVALAKPLVQQAVERHPAGQAQSTQSTVLQVVFDETDDGLLELTLGRGRHVVMVLGDRRARDPGLEWQWQVCEEPFLF